MGAVRFSVDPRLLRQLTKLLPLDLFVETGTYHGDSVRAALPFFKELHTIELSDQLFAGAEAAFKDSPAVRVHHGHSADVLEELGPRLKRKKVLYWLDAHWCEADAAEESDNCPLLGELKAIGKLGRRDVVLIDDARLFTAPPPPPADPGEWPDINQVLSGLASLAAPNAPHELIVIDDVIVFAPREVMPAVRKFARNKGVDWLEEMNRTQRLMGGLKRLESVVGEGLDQRAMDSQRLGEMASSIETLATDDAARRTGEQRRLDEIGRAVEGLGGELDKLSAQSQASQEFLERALPAEVEPLKLRMEVMREAVEKLSAQPGGANEALERLLPSELEPLKLRLELIREHVDQLSEQSKSSRAAIERVLAAELGPIKGGFDQIDGRLAAIEGLGPEVGALGKRLEELSRDVSSLAAPRRARLRRRRRLKRLLRPLLAPFALIALPFRKLGQIPMLRRWRVHLGVYLARFRLQPKLGRLEHHPPTEVKVPKRYLRPVRLDDPPVISIVTPSYNQGMFIEQTLTSVLDQDYPRLEYVVQDGNSTDNTREILERYAPRLQRWVMGDDDGHAHAVNLGFEGTSGEIMAWINSDDILLPGSLAYVARYFEKHPKVDALYGHRVLINSEEKEIGRWVMPRHTDGILSWADYVPQETLFWRRERWERIGGALDLGWPFAFDWDFLLRLVEADARIVRVPRFLGGFRIHEAQKTTAIGDSQGAEEMTRIRIRMLGREPSRQEISRAIRWYLRRHVILHKLYRAHLLRY